MASVITPTRYTPEDLLTMPDGDGYELHEGDLVELKRGYWSSYVAGNLLRLLGEFCKEHSLGWAVGGGAGFQCFPEKPATVRRANVSFIRTTRLSLQQATEAGHLLIAPDLVTEVVSPNDRAYDVDAKVGEWLSAGVRLVWVVSPPARLVRIHRGDGGGVIVSENDLLSGEDVVPGFQCRVGDLFLPPAGVAALEKNGSQG